jgi:glutaredoxin-like YruB-family protein
MANVIIYSAPWCVYCKMAKAYMDENKVKYTELDVSADEKAKEDMIKKSGQLAIPVMDVDGEIIIGFDKPALKEALGLK